MFLIFLFHSVLLLFSISFFHFTFCSFTFYFPLFSAFSYLLFFRWDFVLVRVKQAVKFLQSFYYKNRGVGEFIQ